MTAGTQDEACPECGLTRRELYAEGRMGCARCYRAFAAEVERALTEIHGTSVHIGKVGETHGDDRDKDRPAGVGR